MNSKLVEIEKRGRRAMLTSRRNCMPHLSIHKLMNETCQSSKSDTHIMRCFIFC